MSTTWDKQNPEYHATYLKEWRKQNPNYSRDHMRKSRQANPTAHKQATLKRKYGMTLADFNALLLAQGGKCAICRCVLVEGKPNVDHCHDTGKIRGILCWPCNVGIGQFKNNAEFLVNAAAYLLEDS